MTETESDHDRLIRMEEHVVFIRKALEDHPPIRHANKEGICDAYETVIAHDRRMNQWIGFMAAISLLFSFLGWGIATVISRAWK